MDNNKDKKEISISARDVLQHLNSLGYTEITGQQLKYFIKDLKKLIKYDMQQISEKDFQCKIHMTGPERLHDIPTYSWKSKCPNREDKTFKPQSAPNHTSSNSIERTSIKNKDEGCPNNVLRESKSANIHPIKNSNIIKVHNIEKPKKSDPVALYHYYASLWEKYKPNLPGENNWADLRWSIREKLVSAENQRPSSAPQKGKVKKRKEWVD